jgi:hypothetical protein
MSHVPREVITHRHNNWASTIFYTLLFSSKFITTFCSFDISSEILIPARIPSAHKLATRAAPLNRAPRAIVPVWYAVPLVEEAELAAEAAEDEAEETWPEAEDVSEEAFEDAELAGEEAADEADEPVTVAREDATDEDSDAMDERPKEIAEEMEDAILD